MDAEDFLGHTVHPAEEVSVLPYGFGSAPAGQVQCLVLSWYGAEANLGWLPAGVTWDCMNQCNIDMWLQLFCSHPTAP
jgi:hypothetical protein